MSGYLPFDLMTNDIKDKRRLKVETNHQTSAFGDLATVQPDPIIQITAQYGIRDNVISANLGGSTSEVGSNFVISTGTGANNVGALVSRMQAAYRAGQGIMCRYTALFTEGVADSTQLTGLLNSEAGFGFGYNGTDYGIFFARDGGLEYQRLQITSAALAPENATVTIDGTPFIIPITATTVEQNAFEIATYLDANNPAYAFASRGDVVECLGTLPDLGGGAFTFSSATATGVFTDISSGLAPVETWIPKAEWNVNNSIDIDPTKGNVYQVQLQYLGYGGIKFFVEDPVTAIFELVHIIRYANTSERPIVTNPIFRVGWGARNTGNTSDVVIKGASAAVFNEGEVVITGEKTGIGLTKAGIGTTLTNILTIRNRITLDNLPNRADIYLLGASFGTDTTKTGSFAIIRNPEVVTGGFLDFTLNNPDRLAELAVNDVEIVGGETIAIFNVKSGQIYGDSLKFASPLLPGDVLCIAAKVTSGSASEFDTSISWQDDL